MPAYHQIAVPEHLLPRIYRLIADDADAGVVASTESTPFAAMQAETDTEESRNWTLDELEELYASDAPSVKLFTQVLTILVARAPEPMPIEDIAEKTGVPALTMQSTFGPVTRYIRNRFGGDKRWPIHWSDDNAWYMNEHNASRWRHIVG